MERHQLRLQLHRGIINGRTEHGDTSTNAGGAERLQPDLGRQRIGFFFF